MPHSTADRPPRPLPYMRRYKALVNDLLEAIGPLPKGRGDSNRLIAAAKRVAKTKMAQTASNDPSQSQAPISLIEAVAEVYASAAAAKVKTQKKYLSMIPADIYARIEQEAQASGLPFNEVLRAGLERAFPPTEVS